MLLLLDCSNDPEGGDLVNGDSAFNLLLPQPLMAKLDPPSETKWR